MRQPTWKICLMGLLLSAAQAWAQSNTVRLVVPFATGGPTDIAARVIAPLLSEAMGKTVIVDNRVGATGAIGAEFVARAPADGQTILFGTSSIMAANPALMPKLSFDPVRDFAPVSLIATIENILVVHPSVPVNNVPEFIRYAKDNPGKLFYGSSGIGSTYHLGAEMFANMTKTQLSHVPYKGQGPAAQDLLAGHLQLMFDAFNSAVPNIKAGRVKALGIASAKRHPDLPDLPTISEQGVPGYVTTIWIAFFLPAKTPTAVVEKMNADLKTILQRPDVRERFAKLGMQSASSSTGELDTLLKQELALWSRVVKDGNIKPE
ncbi:Bug family tripartite tricarboxylate transporter substrate binding protein [Limnohabitans sp.]|uniref:Bug family tripartite tricarboxylate transporter substrate binding protein n=1 Tax=Limnohabitans sp. TaxID=1907725 RepID=UPI0038BCDA99